MNRTEANLYLNQLGADTPVSIHIFTADDVHVPAHRTDQEAVKALDNADFSDLLTEIVENDENYPPEPEPLADRIADACLDSFSFDRWGWVAFRDIAQEMLNRGYRSDQIIGVLHHSCMRHTADATASALEEKRRIIPASRFFNHMGSSLTQDFANKAIFHDQPTVTKEG